MGMAVCTESAHVHWNFPILSTCVISLGPPSSSGKLGLPLMSLMLRVREGAPRPLQHTTDRWQNWSQIVGLELSP